MEEVHGWSSYGPMPTVYRDAPAAEEELLRPELADLGRLARRGMRAVVKTARAEDRPRLSRILLEHLGSGAGAFDVVEETWRPYDHVNVQAGIDAWLAEPARTYDLVGVVTQHGQPVALAELLSHDGPVDHFGPRPGPRRCSPPAPRRRRGRTRASAPAAGRRCVPRPR